jgi:hypothetical protein
MTSGGKVSLDGAWLAAAIAAKSVAVNVVSAMRVHAMVSSLWRSAFTAAALVTVASWMSTFRGFVKNSATDVPLVGGEEPRIDGRFFVEFSTHRWRWVILGGR